MSQIEYRRQIHQDHLIPFKIVCGDYDIDGKILMTEGQSYLGRTTRKADGSLSYRYKTVKPAHMLVSYVIEVGLIKLFDRDLKEQVERFEKGS
jgi:hypothetical protein